METGLLFILLGLVVFVSFIANSFFRKTKIPEPLFLILMGIVLGPVVGLDEATILVLAPIFTALVLIVILLDNGLEMNIFQTAREIPRATAFTVALVAANIVAIGWFSSWILGWPLLYGLLFGTVVSGTTTDIVSTLANRLPIQKRTRQLLILESVINDVQLIAFVVFLNLIQYAQINVGAVLLSVVLQVPVAVLLGVTTAVLWVYVLGKWIGNHPLAYVATIGSLLLLYGFAQILRSSGPMAVLTFSLILGNARQLMKQFAIPVVRFPKFTGRTIGTIRMVEMDLSFFVKSFFFVFLGLAFSLSVATVGLLEVSLAVVGIILALRFIGTAMLPGLAKRDRLATVFLMPRGYMASVMAFLAVGVVPNILGLTLLNIYITTFAAIGAAAWLGRTKNKLH